MDHEHLKSALDICANSEEREAVESAKALHQVASILGHMVPNLDSDEFLEFSTSVKDIICRLEAESSKSDLSGHGIADVDLPTVGDHGIRRLRTLSAIADVLKSYVDRSPIWGRRRIEPAFLPAAIASMKSLLSIAPDTSEFSSSLNQLIDHIVRAVLCEQFQDLRLLSADCVAGAKYEDAHLQTRDLLSQFGTFILSVESEFAFRRQQNSVIRILLDQQRLRDAFIRVVERRPVDDGVGAARCYRNLWVMGLIEYDHRTQTYSLTDLGKYVYDELRARSILADRDEPWQFFARSRAVGYGNRNVESADAVWRLVAAMSKKRDTSGHS